MPERHVHVLIFTTWHTIVMGLQYRLQLLKKVKGSCVQFFGQIHTWMILLTDFYTSCYGQWLSHFVVSCFLWNRWIFMEIPYTCMILNINWILFYISSQNDLLIKIIHVYDTYFYNYFIIADIGDGPLAEIPESHTEVSSFLLLYWMCHHICCMTFKKWN